MRYVGHTTSKYSLGTFAVNDHSKIAQSLIWYALVLSWWIESSSHTLDVSEILWAFKARLQTCQVRPASGHSASGDANPVPKDCIWRSVGVFSWQTKRFVITGHLLGMFPPNPVKIHLSMCFLRDLSSKKAIGRLAIWLYQRVSSPKDSRGMINLAFDKSCFSVS